MTQLADVAAAFPDDAVITVRHHRLGYRATAQWWRQGRTAHLVELSTIGVTEDEALTRLLNQPEVASFGKTR